MCRDTPPTVAARDVRRDALRRVRSAVRRFPVSLPLLLLLLLFLPLLGGTGRLVCFEKLTPRVGEGELVAQACLEFPFDASVPVI